MRECGMFMPCLGLVWEWLATVGGSFVVLVYTSTCF